MRECLYSVPRSRNAFPYPQRAHTTPRPVMLDTNSLLTSTTILTMSKLRQILSPMFPEVLNESSHPSALPFVQTESEAH